MRILYCPLILFIFVSVFIWISGGKCEAAEDISYRVAATAIVEHPALNSIRDGIRDILEDRGYQSSKVRFTYESAQGNAVIAAQIARRLAGENPDVIVAIGTPSALAIASATRSIPVVFSGVTDPVSARLVRSLQNPGGNVTGVTDSIPVDDHLDMILSFVPDLEILGVPYNPGEANAVNIIEALKQAASKRNIQIITAAADKSSMVLSAAQSLVGKSDALFALSDNTIVTAIESLIKLGINNKIPVFASDSGSVERGAIAAVGFNYYKIGIQTGGMIIRILEGISPASLPVEMPDTREFYINALSAAAMGINIPKESRERATKIIE